MSWCLTGFLFPLSLRCLTLSPSLSPSLLPLASAAPTSAQALSDTLSDNILGVFVPKVLK